MRFGKIKRVALAATLVAGAASKVDTASSPPAQQGAAFVLPSAAAKKVLDNRYTETVTVLTQDANGLEGRAFFPNPNRPVDYVPDVQMNEQAVEDLKSRLKKKADEAVRTLCNPGNRSARIIYRALNGRIQDESGVDCASAKGMQR
jgi:hypothetical protein